MLYIRLIVDFYYPATTELSQFLNKFKAYVKVFEEIKSTSDTRWKRSNVTVLENQNSHFLNGLACTDLGV